MDAELLNKKTHELINNTWTEWHLFTKLQSSRVFFRLKNCCIYFHMVSPCILLA